ncbi:PaaI family thioesterase [Pseudopontixanthobacter vadosimaris]|uniref:PaaI family thioesterase n=1 Tax=Pseudopontixanthobacter vadosimaris TaxID=2726450 RepID=UPI00147645E7|nr:PaaI family thioesterase [Pseudopontixanthobacter vadosimaris]
MNNAEPTSSSRGENVQDARRTRFDPAAAAPLLLSQNHGGWLGLRYRDHGPDWAELELPWRADLIGEASRDVLASGPIVSLMDMASGMSVWVKMGEFRAIATLDLRVDYMRPSKEGANVIGRAECYRLTNSAAFVRGIAHDGDADDPVAHIAGSFMAIMGQRL